MEKKHRNLLFYAYGKHRFICRTKNGIEYGGNHMFNTIIAIVMVVIAVAALVVSWWMENGPKKDD